MACLLDCLSDIGPPPNSIKFLPPPPIPAFLQGLPPPLELLGRTIGNNSGCAAQLCDRWLLGALGAVGGHAGISNGDPSPGRGAVLMPSGGEYVDLPRHDWGETSNVPSEPDVTDTWLMVLIGCSVGVLLLGAVLALFLLRCREVLLLAHRQHHQTKAAIPHHHGGHLDHCAQHRGTGVQIKLPGPGGDAVLYPTHHHHHGHHHHHSLGPTTPVPTDNRLLWATLTPRGGTQHFISENYPQDFLGDYGPTITNDPADNTYETIENYQVIPQSLSSTNTNLPPPIIKFKANEKSSFDNSGFVDYDYEDPTPLIESYQLNDIDNDHEYVPYGEIQQHVIHSSTNSLRNTNSRPVVSSPTRIEHPNMPPLNLYPHRAGIHPTGNSTLRRGTLSRRGSDISSFGK